MENKELANIASCFGVPKGVLIGEADSCLSSVGVAEQQWLEMRRRRMADRIIAPMTRNSVGVEPEVGW